MIRTWLQEDDGNGDVKGNGDDDEHHYQYKTESGGTQQYILNIRIFFRKLIIENYRQSQWTTVATWPSRTVGKSRTNSVERYYCKSKWSERWSFEQLSGLHIVHQTKLCNPTRCPIGSVEECQSSSADKWVYHSLMEKKLEREEFFLSLTFLSRKMQLTSVFSPRCIWMWNLLRNCKDRSQLTILLPHLNPSD